MISLRWNVRRNNFYGDALVYSMGEPVIGEILNTEGSLKTEVLEAMDKEIINFFEPTYSAPKDSDADIIAPVQPVVMPNNPEQDPEYEVIIPKKPTVKPVVEKISTEASSRISCNTYS